MAHRSTLLVQSVLVALSLGAVPGAAQAQNDGASSSDAAGSKKTVEIAKCSKSFGTLTVVDPRNGIGHLQQYGLGSPSALLRLMVQESGCFDIVERGVAMQNMQQERALAQSGALRSDSNVGQGQMQVADFVMTPDVQIPTNTTSGVGGGLGGLLGSRGALGALGTLAGGVKTREAVTSLLVSDVRSGIQVAAAQGSSKQTDFNIGGALFGGGVGAALGGYTSTAEGKVVSASLLDNYNKIVAGIRDKPQLLRNTTPEAAANAQAATRAEAPQAAGQMLAPKIANVRVYADASNTSTVVATMQRGEELVASGEAKNGFVYVDAANFRGWVQRTLVGPVASSSPGMAVAPAPQAAQGFTQAPMPAPRYRYGRFAGSFDGADQGQFRVLIDDDGSVTGDGSMSRNGAFGLMGQYDAAKGQLAMTGGSKAGNVLFVGRYDPSRGVIVGTWTLGGVGGFMGTNQGGGGSFTAGRQP